MNRKILLIIGLISLFLLTGCSEKSYNNCGIQGMSCYNGSCIDNYDPCSYIELPIIEIEDAVVYYNNESTWITCEEGYFDFNGKAIKCIKEVDLE